MQIWRGEAWEIWSFVVISGRQRIDTRGGGSQQRILKPFLILTVQGLETRHWQGSVNTICHSQQQGYFNTKWQLLLMSGTVYSLSTWRNGTWPDAYCKSSNIRGGNSLGTRLDKPQVPPCLHSAITWCLHTIPSYLFLISPILHHNYKQGGTCGLLVSPVQALCKPL